MVSFPGARPARGPHPSGGRVWLIGAGPGDADSITVRGLRCLREADVVVYDRLADPSLLREARRATELVDAGKAPGRHILGQEQICALLVERAQAGWSVARLKGGDPFVFGRGGEEALACAEAGIRCEVIPGVSSAIAVPATAGIPVTHRGLAASFAVVTGHLAGEPGDPVNWAAAAGLDTVVVLMGIQRLAAVAALLQRHGRSGDTPAAVVERGHTAEERVVTGPLHSIARQAAAAGVSSPAVVVVGEVVRLRSALALPGPVAMPALGVADREWPAARSPEMIRS
jgi:uroporphyrin-III C-methyltransferase